MNSRLFAGALALLLIGGAVPAFAYHIDNALSPLSTFLPLGSGDFEVAGAGTLFILCEREYGDVGGPGATASDDRNDDPALPEGGPGFGGLCTTGRNDASGEAPFPGTNNTTKPPLGTYTRLDACNAITSARNNGTGGPYMAGGLPCASVFTPTADTDDHQWFAVIGAYACTIPTTGNGIDQNYALYYDENYAWVSYDGSPPYTAGDPIGVAHSGDGPNPPGVLNNVDAFHGHVTMFIEAAGNQPGFSNTGSAETSPGAAGADGAGLWHLSPAPAALRTDSTCGGSGGFGNPVNGTGAPPANTPVWRACYVAADCPPPPPPPRLPPLPPTPCSDIWDGVTRTTTPCDPTVTCGPVPPGWHILLTMNGMAPAHAGATLTGEIECGGTGGLSATCTADANGDSTTSATCYDQVVTGVPGTGTPACERIGGTFPMAAAGTTWSVRCTPDP